MKFLVYLFTLLSVQLYAERYQYAGEFLLLGADARAAGVGNAVTALCDDATATYWNPAGLSRLHEREVAFMHSEVMGDDIGYDILHYAIPVKGVGGIGVSLLRLGLGDVIPVTDLADTGAAISADNPVLQTGTMSSADYALLLGHGLRIKAVPGLRAGLTMKLIRREIGPYYAYGIGTDAGIQYELPAGTAGITVRDVTGSVISWNNGTRDYLTPSVAIGAAVTVWVEELRGNVTFSGVYCPDELLDGTASATASPIERYVMDPVIMGGIGVEYSLRDVLFIRTGTVDRDVTAGIGIAYAGFSADYAFTIYNTFEKSDMQGDLERTHRISGAYRF